MKFSVALCTYNGSKYIEQQLLSIVKQDYPVDEIIICDDGSKDDTLDKVKKIAYNHNEIQWIIEQNNPNLGFCDNFAKAFSLCHGDIIFLSDQDDIWYPNKSKVIATYFEKNKDKNVIFSNAHFIDENDMLAYGGQTTFETVGMTQSVQSQLDRGWALEFFTYENHATGCTMAFRRSLLTDGWNVSSERKNKFGTPFHDLQLVFKALETDSLGYITEILTQYRIHSSQQCGLTGWINNPPHWGKVYKAVVSELTTLDVAPHTLHRMQFLGKRTEYINSPLGYQILTHIPEYKKYYGNRTIDAIISDYRQYIANNYIIPLLKKIGLR